MSIPNTSISTMTTAHHHSSKKNAKQPVIENGADVSMPSESPIGESKSDRPSGVSEGPALTESRSFVVTINAQEDAAMHSKSLSSLTETDKQDDVSIASDSAQVLQANTSPSLIPGLALKRRIKVPDKDYFTIKKALGDSISKEQQRQNVDVNVQIKPLVLMKIIQYIQFIKLENEEHMNIVVSVLREEVPALSTCDQQTLLNLIQKIKEILEKSK